MKLKRHWVVGIVIVAAALIVAALLLRSEDVAVPDVTGMSQAEATTALENAGLATGDVTESADEQVAAGLVVSQEPAADTEIAEGDAVALVVSSGPAAVKVPDVLGMTQSDASTALEEAGLKLGGVTKVYSESAEKGSVIGQAPTAGLEVRPGSQVAVAVSQGAKPPASPAPVAVPDVAGQSADGAGETLTSAGFVVVVYEAQSATVPEGTIIGQVPSGGVLAESGSTVTVVVSTGPPK